MRETGVDGRGLLSLWGALRLQGEPLCGRWSLRNLCHWGSISSKSCSSGTSERWRICSRIWAAEGTGIESLNPGGTSRTYFRSWCQPTSSSSSWVAPRSGIQTPRTDSRGKSASCTLPKMSTRRPREERWRLGSCLSKVALNPKP